MIALLICFVGFTFILALSYWAFRLGQISAQYLKRSLQAAWVILLLLPLLQFRTDSEPLFQVEMQKWIPIVEATSVGSLPALVPLKIVSEVQAQSSQNSHFPSLGMLIKIFCAFGGLAFLVRYLVEARRYQNLQRRGLKVRSYSGLRIFISSEVKSAFCYGILRKTIFIPAKDYFIPLQRSVVLAHEFSHLQARDPFWTLAMEFVRYMFFWTGFSFLWRQWFLLASEVACDQRANRRLSLSSRDYFYLLINHLCKQTVPFGSTGVSLSYQHMKRRIQMYQTSKTRKLSGIVLASFLGIGMVAGAAVNFAKVTGVKWTVDDLRKVMAGKGTEVPVIYHKAVARELTRFLSSADTKWKLRKAFARMRVYEDSFRLQLREAQLPAEYVLLPLIESAYQNIDAVGNRSGGMWQFIPETARKYGLKVTEDIDERFDIPKATTAAIQYLKYMNDLFKDSQLALLSYNMGESALRKQLLDSGAKTVEDLLESGDLSRESHNHAARFQAAMILYRNPQLL
jgi:membrane-bound lytic murein transglycosylase D